MKFFNSVLLLIFIIVLHVKKLQCILCTNLKIYLIKGVDIMKLTENFTLNEFLKTYKNNSKFEINMYEFFTGEVPRVEEVYRFSKSDLEEFNTLKGSLGINLQKCATVAQEIRDLMNKYTMGHVKYVMITSWYRPTDYNKSVDGHEESRHIDGLAFDFKTSTDNETVVMALKTLISEGVIRQALRYRWGYHVDVEEYRYASDDSYDASSRYLDRSKEDFKV